jgi:hypothetical protein
MLIALVILAMLGTAILWLIIRTVRLPRKSAHDRQAEKLHDPIVTAFKGPQGPGG